MGRALGRKCPRAGVRVRHPGGDTGVVTKMQLPSGKVATCTGPGAKDLVYVKWDAGMTMGVPKTSLERTRERGGLGTLNDVWRMNPAGREGPPLTEGRILEILPGDYVVNDEPLEAVHLPQYRTRDQLAQRMQSEWVENTTARLKRSGLGDAGETWQPRPFTDALFNGKPVHVQSITDGRAVIIPAGFRRGMPMNVPVNDLQPLRGLGITWTSQPGTRAQFVYANGQPVNPDSQPSDATEELRYAPQFEVETKPEWSSRFYRAGLLLKDVKEALARRPEAAMVPVPEWNDLSQSYVLEENGRARHRLWARADLEQILAAEDHYRSIMPPEAQFRGLGWDDTTHAQEFDRARFEVMQSAADAETAMRQGQCKVAGALIDEAYVQYGFMKGNATTPEQMSTAIDVHKAIQKVDRPFEQRCVRDEPVSETYERSMSMMRPGLAGKKR